MYYDSYYQAMVYSNGTMASAAPYGATGDDWMPVWYTQWRKIVSS